MIEGYIGIPGTGKTLSMTVRAYKERRYYDEIISNYGLNFGSTKVLRFNEPDELLRLLTGALENRDGKRRLLLLDEVHLLFDARMWSKVPAEFLRILAQPRKAKLDMYYTAQHESQVEKRLRTVTNWLWLCRCFGADFNPVSDSPFVFWQTCYEPFTFRLPHAKTYGSRWFRFHKKHGRLFDTMEVLDRMDLSKVGTAVSPPEAPR